VSHPILLKSSANVILAKAGISCSFEGRGGAVRGWWRLRIKSGLAILAMVVAMAIFATMPLPVAAQGTLPPAPYAYRQLDDPAQEEKAKELMETLRCLTCQSQSIADSAAPIAGDMRHQVRTRIAAGEDPEDVRQWLIERYGDYISYAPQVTARTWPLFVIPVLLLAAALLIIGRRLGAVAKEQ